MLKACFAGIPTATFYSKRQVFDNVKSSFSSNLRSHFKIDGERISSRKYLWYSPYAISLYDIQKHHENDGYPLSSQLAMFSGCIFLVCLRTAHQLTQ